MPDGFKLGGIAQGFTSGFGAVSQFQGLKSQQALKQAQLEASQAENLRKLRDDAQKQIDNAISQANEITLGADTSTLEGFGRDDPSYIKTIDLLEEGAISLGKQINLDPAIIQSRFQKVRTQQTPEEKAIEEAKKQARIKGAVAAAQQAEKPPDAETFVFPGGAFEAVDLTAPGARNKVAEFMKRGGTPIHTQLSSPSRQGLLPTKGEREDFRESEIATRNVVSEVDRIKSQMKGGVLTGMTGGIVRGLDSMANTTVQMVKTLGVDHTSLLNPANYDFSAFGDKAAASAGFRANISNFAYVVARSREPNARALTDKDVQNAMNSFSGESGSQQQVSAALDEVVRQSKSNLFNRFTVLQRADPSVAFPQDLLLQSPVAEEDISTIDAELERILRGPTDAGL